MDLPRVHVGDIVPGPMEGDGTVVIEEIDAEDMVTFRYADGRQFRTGMPAFTFVLLHRE